MRLPGHSLDEDGAKNPDAADFGHTLYELQIAQMTRIGNAYRALESALLGRNLESLEQANAELVRCQAELRNIGYENSRRTDSPDDAAGLSSEELEQLREAQMRILQLGRVQAALLARAQGSLAMLANILGGSEVIYGPPAGKRALPSTQVPCTGERRCRV